MSGATASPLNPFAWLGGPMALAAVAQLLFALPVRVFGLQPPEPVFALVPAFAWAVIRPSVLPPFALLALGLYLDALLGGPLGLWPLCLLAAYAPVLAARRFLLGQGLIVLWVWYAGACAAAMAVGVMFMLLRTGAAPGPVGVAWQWLASAALFPFAFRLAQAYEDADVRFR
jgi:rod shape-determining protein MreD